jgi:uncharacterized protein YraI
MSDENISGGNPMNDELDPDGRFTALTGNLGSAFQAQADRFEPSNDAYAKLAHAVTEDQDRRANQSRAVGWFRPLAAAAAVVAVVGVGGVFVANQGSQSLDTGPGGDDGTAAAEVASEEQGESDETTPPTEDPVVATTEPATADGETESPTETDNGESATSNADGVPGYGPIRATELEAAQAFMDLLRLDNGAPEMDADGRVLVRSFGEGGVGEGRIVAELAMANLNEGFAVAEAYAELIFVDAVFQGPDDGSTMRIEGSGTGFESVLDIKVMAAFDNRVLGSGFVTAGNLGEPTPFTAEVDVVGDEHGWVVVSSSGGASGVIDPFAAKPVSFKSVTDPTEYAVIGVAADDPDGGLVVRSGPGTGNDAVGVIPGGTTGLRRNAEYPVPVGTGTWWSVTTEDGLSGWVNSRYVASNEAVSADQLASLASQLPFLITEPAGLPLIRRAPVAIGTIGDPLAATAAELREGSGWTDKRSFPFPDSYGEPQETSLIALTEAEGWVDISPEIGGLYTYESVREAASVNFAGLSSIVFAQDNPTGPWAKTSVFVEDTPGQPEIVAIVVEVQEP